MFIGRERELETLQRLYETGTFQFPVVYGRRRVGKTALIGQFANEHPTVFFTAVEENVEVNLYNLSREIFLFEHPDADLGAAPQYSSLQAAFEAVFQLARSKRLVFVIDEYPYLAKAEPACSSMLQLLIDRNKDSSGLFLILCGSSLSFMREQVLGRKSPLYGRRTAQIELLPFDFFDALRFFPGADPVVAAQLYGMAGGVPLYLLQFDASLSVEGNVTRAFLDPSSILYEEPQNLLKQEVQKSALYNAVIGAIASGKSANNEIATTVGLTSTELTYYLKELQRIGLVVRETPVLGSTRRAVYRLSDNLFRFWYRFVSPNRSTIERGITTRALHMVGSQLSTYMGPVFEQICAEWLWRMNANGQCGYDFDELGRWWGNDPELRREEELDIVCTSGKQACLVAECKWRNEPTGTAEAETLERRMRLVGAPVGTKRYLFSKTGFTAACVERAALDESLQLVTLEEMVTSVQNTTLYPASTSS